MTNVDELRASAYGREQATLQRANAADTMRDIAHSLSTALDFAREGAPFVAGVYVGEASAALANLFFLPEEYARATALYHAVYAACDGAQYRR